MNLNLESRDGLLLATVTGRVLFREALKCWNSVCDAAAERGAVKSCLTGLVWKVRFPIWRSMK